jgi:hypothetical protein
MRFLVVRFNRFKTVLAHLKPAPDKALRVAIGANSRFYWGKTPAQWGKRPVYGVKPRRYPQWGAIISCPNSG